MPLVLVGLNHNSAPIDLRERLTCGERGLPHALASAVACPEVREVVILSTCNRMEVYALVETAGVPAAFAILTDFLAELHTLPRAAFADHLYLKAEHEAATHLMRVASGVDSLVIGEGQILGQVRAALRSAQEAATTGAVLNGLFQQAIACGKRVRTETELGRGAFSIGRAAVDLASCVFANLSHASVLLLGAGKMSDLTATHLKENGVKVVIVANRTYEKAVAMAARLGGKAIHYDALADALITADIVISSTAAPHPIIRRETLLPILRKRRGRPLFLIDIAFPRDIDPDVNGLDNVYLRNLEDLKAVVEEDGLERRQEVTRAEDIAAEEAVKFLTWVRAREAAPVITLLREQTEQIRQSELDLLRSQLPSLSEREWQKVEAMTRALMNKWARNPILRLKQESGGAQDAEEAIRYDLLTAAREIFGLTLSDAAVIDDEPRSLPAELGEEPDPQYDLNHRDTETRRIHREKPEEERVPSESPSSFREERVGAPLAAPNINTASKEAGEIGGVAGAASSAPTEKARSPR